jgi:hypothetical protein
VAAGENAGVVTMLFSLGRNNLPLHSSAMVSLFSVSRVSLVLVCVSHSPSPLPVFSYSLPCPCRVPVSHPIPSHPLASAFYFVHFGLMQPVFGVGVPIRRGFFSRLPSTRYLPSSNGDPLPFVVAAWGDG